MIINVSKIFLLKKYVTKQLISLKPFDELNLSHKINERNKTEFLDIGERLCHCGHLHQFIYIMGKYIPDYL